MCSPAAAVGVTAFGMLYQSSAAIEQAKARNTAAEYNARIMERNAALAEKEAAWIESAGRNEIARLKRDLALIMGSQKSSYGASGAVVDSGSTAHVVEDTEKMGLIDALTIERNYAREAWAKRQEGQGYLHQAELSRLGMVDPYKAGFTSLMTSTTSVASNYAAYGMNSSLSSPKKSSGIKASRPSSMNSASRYGGYTTLIA